MKWDYVWLPDYKGKLNSRDVYVAPFKWFVDRVKKEGVKIDCKKEDFLQIYYNFLKVKNRSYYKIKLTKSQYATIVIAENLLTKNYDEVSAPMILAKLRTLVDKKKYTLPSISYYTLIKSTYIEDINIGKYKTIVDDIFKSAMNFQVWYNKENLNKTKYIYDMNSMFPYLLHSKSNIVYAVGKPFTTTDRPKNYNHIVRFKIKTNKNNFPKIKPNCIECFDLEYIGKDAIYSLWRLQFEYFIKYYDLKPNKLELVDYIDFEESKVGIGIDDKLSEFYELKRTATDEADRSVYKMILNSLWGKLAARQTRYNKEHQMFKYRTHTILIASQLISYVRLYMAKIINSNYDKFVYSCVDSIHSTEPLDLPISDKLGEWKEQEVIKSIYIGPASYAYKKPDGQWKNVLACPNKSIDIDEMIDILDKTGTYVTTIKNWTDKEYLYNINISL